MINTPEGLHKAARLSVHTLQRKDIHSDLKPVEARVPKWYLDQQYSGGQEPWKILNQSGNGVMPRCDGCRENKLKCDRVLPRCDQCTLVSDRVCIYTPFPVNNFRGMPRCERCREMNLLQCDRETPCGNCTLHKVECSYALSRRLQNDGSSVTTSLRTAFTSDRRPSNAPQENLPGMTRARTYQSGELSDGGIYTEDEESSDTWPRTVHRFPAGIPRIAQSQIVPWINPAFADLPQSVLTRLSQIPARDMPTRSAYNDTLGRFVLSLPPEQAEISMFPPDNYSNLHDALKTRSAAGLSESLTKWVSIHRVQVGSHRQLRLIMLSDSAYHLNAHDERRTRAAYISRADSKPAFGQSDDPESAASSTQAFDRLPVSPQIYDLLTWAHREHNTVSSMLKEVQQAGFATITPTMAILYITLCPVCKTFPRSDNQNANISDT